MTEEKLIKLIFNWQSKHRLLRSVAGFETGDKVVTSSYENYGNDMQELSFKRQIILIKINKLKKTKQ